MKSVRFIGYGNVSIPHYFSNFLLIIRWVTYLVVTLATCSHCERRWLKSKSEADHEAYIEKLKIKSKVIESAKEDYYHERLYRVSKNVLYPKMQNFKNLYYNEDNQIWYFDLFK